MDNIFGAGGAAIGAGGPEQWFRSLPIITRIWLGSTLAVTALANLRFFQWTDFDLSRWEDVVGWGSSGRVEAWRLVDGWPLVFR